jgi:hypothetical protein
MAVNYQFREQHEIGLCRGCALAPTFDRGQNPLWFPQ